MREIAKDYGKDIKVAVHYTNIEDYEGVDTMAANLQNAGVDYDLFGLSDIILTGMERWKICRQLRKILRTPDGKDVYIAATLSPDTV